jgi:hypothetical protein
LLGLGAIVFLATSARSLPGRSPTEIHNPALPIREPINLSGYQQKGPRIAGVALGLFAEDTGFSYGPLLDEIVALGATHVALIVPLYQLNGASTELFLHTRFSPTLEAVAEAIREAKRAGLDVTVFPIVRLLSPRSPQEWRGTLAPTDRDAWFQSYGQRLGELAALAMLTESSRLVVGSELSTLDSDLRRWRPLIRNIRGSFPGTLVYSANWDHYTDAAIFELVDELGVTGYFSLRKNADPPDVEKMALRWRALGHEIENALARYQKPFVFTEVGYRSRKHATAEPWDEGSGGDPDPEEQVRGFEAFRQTWAKPGLPHPRLDGVYIWNYYGYGGLGSAGYTPRGKPALKVVRDILSNLRGL